MENIKYVIINKLKKDTGKSIEERKEIFNKKLLNIILKSENKVC